MERRDFIVKSAATAAGILSAPYVFANKRADEVILGHGKKRYKLDTKWSQADITKYPVKDCHEIVQDSKGRVLLLTNETKNNVIIYDKKGKLLSSWGSEVAGAKLMLTSSTPTAFVWIFVIRPILRWLSAPASKWLSSVIRWMENTCQPFHYQAPGFAGRLLKATICMLRCL